MRWLPALILDLAVVLLFVLLGRSTHDEGNAVLGVVTTWWPFAVGMLAGWAAVWSARKPLSLVPTGVTVWISTAVLGMVLRWATGGGTAPAFIVVATAFLGAVLLGWRTVALLISRMRQRRHDSLAQL